VHWQDPKADDNMLICVYSTGYYPSVVSRRDLLETLHRALPKHAQEKVLTGKKLSEIQATPNGVTVSCTDGTAYNGAFVIGADGAYSAVRKFMRELAMDAGSDANEAEPFLTTYQALWIRFPVSRLPACKPGSATETHGSGIATQLFVGEDTATVGVYRRLPIPTKRPLRYDEKDQAALVEEWGHLPLLKNGAVSLKDAYEARTGSGLVGLEEGVLPHWSWDGRVVLVGDAAHKFTPSTGSGLNYGIIDAVFLMNELHALSRTDADDDQPPWQQSALSGAFQTYQEKRQEDVTAGCKQASGATAVATWTNVGLKLLDQYVLPNSMVQWLIGCSIASKARAAKPLRFDFE
jgi:2-polyprenyl-6-methoxyphenol hydroxylase-like FAD-dependent oxidoreductase